MKLESYLEEELKAELDRREKAKNTPPEPLSEPNFSKLTEMILQFVKESHDSKYEDEDTQHYIYEAAVEAVYGKAYWIWRNRQKW